MKEHLSVLPDATGHTEFLTVLAMVMLKCDTVEYYCTGARNCAVQSVLLYY